LSLRCSTAAARASGPRVRSHGGRQTPGVAALGLLQAGAPVAWRQPGRARAAPGAPAGRPACTPPPGVPAQRASLSPRLVPAARSAPRPSAPRRLPKRRREDHRRARLPGAVRAGLAAAGHRGSRLLHKPPLRRRHAVEPARRGGRARALLGPLLPLILLPLPLHLQHPRGEGGEGQRGRLCRGGGRLRGGHLCYACTAARLPQLPRPSTPTAALPPSMLPPTRWPRWTSPSCTCTRLASSASPATRRWWAPAPPLRGGPGFARLARIVARGSHALLSRSQAWAPPAPPGGTTSGLGAIPERVHGTPPL
jgi:hypothetical protein